MPISVKNWYSPEEAAETYAETLKWNPATAPVGYSGSFHVGDGLWRTYCGECGDYAEHWGAMPRYATVGPHEVEMHGKAVPGINVGILPA